jgi:hypothetical protein
MDQEADEWLADDNKIDIDEITSSCSEIQEDLIQTFDACLSLKPQRIDIV